MNIHVNPIGYELAGHSAAEWQPPHEQMINTSAVEALGATALVNQVVTYSA